MFNKPKGKTSIKMQWAAISPAIAQNILDHTTATAFPQRPVLPSTVSRYANEMKQGTWHSHTADVIRLAKYKGGYAVLDGQHRLAAIVKSGTSQDAWIAIDVPQSAFKYVDQGTPRSLTHVISAAGWPSAGTLAQAARMLYDRDRGVIPTVNKGTGQCSGTMFDMISERYGDLCGLWDVYGTLITKAAKSCFTGKAIVLFSFYLWEKQDHDKAVNALKFMAYPTEEKEPDKVWVFAREKMLENDLYFKQQHAQGTAVRTELQKYRQAMVLRFAWSCSVSGKHKATTQTGFTRSYNGWHKKVSQSASWADYAA